MNFTPVIISFDEDVKVPQNVDTTKLEKILNEEYKKTWYLSSVKEDPSLCNKVTCLHVSEITYCERRSDKLSGTMLIGLEAEKGFCEVVREVGNSLFFCPSVKKFVKFIEIDGEDVAIIGSPDGFVRFPRELLGTDEDVIAPLEKKTSFSLVNGTGSKIEEIAMEQCVVYAWMTNSPLCVLQLSKPVRQNDDYYYVSHKVYLVDIWNNYDLFMKRLTNRIKCVLEKRNSLERKWPKCCSQKLSVFLRRTTKDLSQFFS